MRTSIDQFGRLVVPKQLRERVGLGSGGMIDITERGGVLEICPVPDEVEIRADEDGLVAHRLGGLRPLTGEDVRFTIEDLRR